MSSLRSIVSSPAFLALWALAGIPAAAMMCHDVALAATTGTAIGATTVLTPLAHGSALFAVRLLGAAAAVTTSATGTSLASGPGAAPGR